ncbi:MAG: DNA polymerase III subunit epsilon [Burkholderiales bacterium]
MRQIVLDTETTGLDPMLGHRVIEIGAVELVNRRPTDRHFHHYLNPERESDGGALQVHGLTPEFLQDKPKFREIAAELLDFVRGAELIIHNAPFDVAFLNAEFALVELGAVEACCACITDTLRLAKELHPGKRNGLDALCERYQVNNSARTLHGALLDAQLLAEVYLAMTRGQESLAMDLEEVGQRQPGLEAGGERIHILVVEASEQELMEHALLLDEIDKASNGRCLWRVLEAVEQRCA